MKTRNQSNAAVLLENARRTLTGLFLSLPLFALAACQSPGDVMGPSGSTPQATDGASFTAPASPSALPMEALVEIATILQQINGTPSAFDLVAVSNVLAQYNYGAQSEQQVSAALLMAQEIAAILDAAGGTPSLEDLVRISEVLAKYGWQGVASAPTGAQPQSQSATSLIVANAISALLAANGGNMTLDDMVLVSQLLAVVDWGAAPSAFPTPTTAEAPDAVG